MLAGARPGSAQTQQRRACAGSGARELLCYCLILTAGQLGGEGPTACRTDAEAQAVFHLEKGCPSSSERVHSLEGKTRACFPVLRLRIQSSQLTSPHFWINLISFSPTSRVLWGKRLLILPISTNAHLWFPGPVTSVTLLGNSPLSRSAHTQRSHGPSE